MIGPDLLYSLDPVRWARERLHFAPDPIQAEVLSSNAKRGILNCSRQWGKSTVCALKALHRAWFRPGSIILAVSPSARQSGEFLRKVSIFVRALGMPVRGDGDNEISLVLPNHSRMIGLPGRETTVRGFSASLLIIDEAAHVPDQMYKAVRPMLAAVNGDLWLMSTPRGQRGFFYEEWNNHAAPWLRIQARATDCPRISPDFLEQERIALGDRWFRQEYLCEFTESDDALFDPELFQDIFYMSER